MMELEKGKGKDVCLLFALIRPRVEQFARECGEGAVPILSKRLAEGGDTRATILAILSLDAIQPGQQAVDLVIKSMDLPKSRRLNDDYGPTLFYLTFCSAETRVAMANFMAERMIKSQLTSGLRFVAMCGDKHTVELLAKAEASMPLNTGGKTIPHPFADATRHVLDRLALPKDQQEQRIRDELRFYQALVGAPHYRSFAMTESVATKLVVARGDTISGQFLVDVLRNASLDPEWESGAGLAALLLVAQKQVEALPALKERHCRKRFSLW
jgi:hypothetical protein